MKYLALVFLVLTFSTFAFSQSSEKRKQFEIDICQPSITSQASFQFSYVYLVVTNESGAVEKVSELLNHDKFKHMVDDEKVIQYIEKWKLKPSERYIVKIDVGTTRTEKSLSISNKTVKIKFIL